MKQIRMKLIALMSVISMLSGCAGMNGDFGCNAKANRGCTPVSEVNQKANAGDFDDQSSGGGRIPLPQKSRALGDSGDNRDYHGAAAMTVEPVRGQGRVQRIWIAPYQDASNHYHASRTVYTVLKNPDAIQVAVKDSATPSPEDE